jgi:hypothetical protein
VNFFEETERYQKVAAGLSSLADFWDWTAAGTAAASACRPAG